MLQPRNPARVHTRWKALEHGVAKGAGGGVHNGFAKTRSGDAVGIPGLRVRLAREPVIALKITKNAA